MNRLRLFTFLALAWLGPLCGICSAGHCGGWSVGLNVGFPAYYPYWGCGYPYGYYYPPYPVYAAPTPVVIQQAPVVVQPAPVAQPAPRVAALEPVPAVTAVSYCNPADVDRHLQRLADANDSARQEAVMELGRMKADRAVDPLAATLAGDRSPAVREAAARALGLIGSTRGLTALKYAAQADNDRDVRHSAQFAVEIIQSQMKH